MALFNAKITVTDQSGSKREVTGTVSHPSPMYEKQRAEVDAATQARTQLQPGERITGVDVRYVRG
jgi:hypothetical protein